MNSREKITWGKKKKEQSLKNLWNHNERSNIHVIGVLEEGESGPEKVLKEIMA